MGKYLIRVFAVLYDSARLTVLMGSTLALEWDRHGFLFLLYHLIYLFFFEKSFISLIPSVFILGLMEINTFWVGAKNEGEVRWCIYHTQCIAPSEGSINNGSCSVILFKSHRTELRIH